MKVGDLIQYQTAAVHGEGVVFLVVSVMPENDHELRCRLLDGNEMSYFDIIVPVRNPYRWVNVLAKGTI